MTGHLNSEEGGDASKYFSKRTSLDDTADVRDLLSAVVGAGKNGLAQDDQAAIFSRLRVLLGQSTADKLINHAFIFNQRNDVMGKTPEQRITQFYDMGSRDQELNSIISKTKQFAQGPVAGSRETSEFLNSKLQGKDALAGTVENKDNIAKAKNISGGL